MDDAGWEQLLPRNTILFVGSGFSAEATNKAGETFLTGERLATRLGQTLGYEGITLPLADVADDFIPDHQALRSFDILGDAYIRPTMTMFWSSAYLAVGSLRSL